MVGGRQSKGQRGTERVRLPPKGRRVCAALAEAQRDEIGDAQPGSPPGSTAGQPGSPPRRALIN